MARVLVVDGDSVAREAIVEMLTAAGYDLVSTGTAARALEIVRDDEVSLVVSEIVMPDLSGLELLEAMRLHRPNLPILLAAGAEKGVELGEALNGRVDGLIAKPFSQAELCEAVERTLESAGQSNGELRNGLLAHTLTSALANALEAREQGMRGHCERLTLLAMRLSLALGLGEDELETIRLGALLHDIGTIGVPDRVLSKAASLTDEEVELMQAHTVIGDNMLAPIDLLAAVRPIVRHHHERWDGAGYPDGLAGEEIPLGARIMAVADAVEAMSASRVYREPLPEPAIVRELELGRGSQWDPAVVDLVLKLIETDAISFSAEGLQISQVLPRRAAAGVFRSSAARPQGELLGQPHKAAQ
jgi:putative two-component system response regulator